MSSHERTPDQERKETGGTAVAPPPATESNGRSFADRVGQRQRMSVPDPFDVTTDILAGVRLIESKQDRQMAIKFGEGRPEDKPSPEVIAKLKDAGYRWNPSDKIWAHPVWPEQAMSIRIEAERLYHELCQMVRKDKGIGSSQGIPF